MGFVDSLTHTLHCIRFCEQYEELLRVHKSFLELFEDPRRPLKFLEAPKSSSEVISAILLSICKELMGALGLECLESCLFWKSALEFPQPILQYS